MPIPAAADLNIMLLLKCERRYQKLGTREGAAVMRGLAHH